MFERRELEHPLRAPFDLADGLRPPKEQNADHGDLGGREAEAFVDHMLVSVDPRPRAGEHDPGQALSGPQAIDRTHGSRLREVQDRVAVRTLIARRDQRVESERVVLRGGELFLDQASEDADFFGRQLHTVRLPNDR